MNISFPLDDLARLVSDSKALSELDISGNDAKPQHFKELFKALAFNKVLHNLNLSWNKILDTANWKDKIDFNLRNWCLQEMMEYGGFTPTLIHVESLADLPVKDMPKLVLESIGRMIRHNKNIQCINLDNTGLNPFVLAHLVPYIRHSKSLLCFHLAQNPGISPQIKEYFAKRLAIAPK